MERLGLFRLPHSCFIGGYPAQLMSVSLRYSITVITFKEFYPKQRTLERTWQGVCCLLHMGIPKFASEFNSLCFLSQPYSVPVFREASCLSPGGSAAVFPVTRDLCLSLSSDKGPKDPKVVLPNGISIFVFF